ncbi:MAG: hypothetical protein IV100_29920 [Myxococcales bacterium]|nr:hypothetical protein [Myxococcales bacterium]
MWLLAVTALVVVGGIGVIWRFWPEPERPEVYQISGAQPGDLNPGQSFIDNVRNYGLPFDLEYRLTTTSEGFRGPETLSAPGGMRILVLGDSFAFGMGVGDEDTFPHQLGLALAARGVSARVWNAAVPGYTIVDQLEQWEQKLARLEPDVVLVCHTASDLKEMARPTSFRRFLAWDDEDSSRPDPDVERVVSEYGGKRGAAAEVYAVSEARLLERLGAGAHAALRRQHIEYLDVLERFARVVAGQPVPDAAGPGGRPRPTLAVVAWVESYGQAGLDVTPLEERCQHLGVRLFRGQRALDRSGVAPDRLYLPDKHFSPEGNRLAARQTADWAVDIGLAVVRTAHSDSERP